MKLLYKLAKDNLKRNKEIYLPYGVSLIFAVIFFFLTINLYFNETINLYYGYSMLKSLLILTAIAISIISLIFNIYINVFLNKRRSMDYGIYDVLGMDKKHIIKLIFIENSILNILSIVIGIISSVILDRLNFMLIAKALDFEKTFQAKINMKAIVLTVLVFALITGLSYVLSSFNVIRKDGLKILEMDKKRKKKSILTSIFTVLGIIFILVGYFISYELRYINSISENSLFYNSYRGPFEFSILAVVFVIIGTFFLFQGLINKIFDTLKKREKIYKRSGNFIFISNLSNRLRENAIGLATISILSCMILVTLSMSIFANIGFLGDNEPFHINLFTDDNDKLNLFEEALKKDLEENNIKIESSYEVESFYGIFNQEDFSLDVYKNGTGTISVMNLSSYNNLVEQKEELEDDKIIFLKSIGNLFEIKEEIDIFGNGFSLVKEVDLREYKELMNIVPEDTIVVSDSIFKDLENKYMYKRLGDGIYINEKGERTDISPIYGKNRNIYIYLDEDKGEIKKITKALNMGTISLKNMESLNDDNYGIRLNGNYTGENTSLSSFIIIGIYLLAIFFINMLLIIYYKQLVEGYEDSEQFKKLSKVGLSKREINNTINKQITIFFFLPLIVALIHFFFATFMMENFILAMKVTNKNTIRIVELSVVLIYILIYFIAYIITSKKYHSVVDKRVKIVD